MLTAENGIIEKAKYAKTVSEISEEKDAIHLSFTEAKTERLLDVDGDILVKPNDLQEGIKKLTNNKEVEVTPVESNEDNQLRVKYIESKREYLVKQNGEVTLLDKDLVEGAITWGPVSWSDGKASVTISSDQEKYYIEYQVGSTSGPWTQGKKKEQV